MIYDFFVCFICKQRVLMLEGQDAELDTAVLRDDADSTAILEQRAWGFAHARCLIDSEWGTVWARVLKRSLFDERGGTFVWQDDTALVLHNDVVRACTVLYASGLALSFPDQSYEQRRTVAGGGLLPVSRGNTIQLDMETYRYVAQAFRQHGRASLLRIEELLQIEDRLLHPDAMRLGVLYDDTDGHKAEPYASEESRLQELAALGETPAAVESSDGTIQDQDDRKVPPSVSGTLSYSVFLGTDLLEPLGEWLQAWNDAHRALEPWQSAYWQLPYKPGEGTDAVAEGSPAEEVVDVAQRDLIERRARIRAWEEEGIRLALLQGWGALELPAFRHSGAGYMQLWDLSDPDLIEKYGPAPVPEPS